MSGDQTTAIAAPEDTVRKEKKAKKDKKKSKEAKEPAQPVDAGVENAGGAMEVDVDGVKEKEKKDKKKRKQKDEDGAIEQIAADATEDIKPKKSKKDKEKKESDSAAEHDDSAMVVDGEAEPQPEPSEKKKKKRKHADVDAEAEAMVVDGAPLEGEPEKKKKKKKREQKDDAGAATEEAEPTTKESKKEKKEKKKRRKELEESTAAALATESSPSTSSLPKPAVSSNGAASTEPPPSSAEASDFLKRHSITITTPSGSSVTPVIKFSQLDGLGVPSSIQAAFKGFKEPTPIQACTWPPALEGKDVVGIAETGSGKTLAFGIPALCRLISSPPSKKSKSSSTVSVLIVAPTRELAIQTHDTLSELGKSFGIASVAVFGGVPKEPQVKMLQNANAQKGGLTTRIIVGTPGRILDLVQEGVCDLSGVDYLVLDEADRMLDKGFENDIRNIISQTKSQEKRQTMMFSATWPEAVRRLASTFQRDPVRVTVGSDDLTANSRVEQVVDVFDDARSKDQRLLTVLKQLSHKKTTTNGASEARILVFALYKKEASRVEQMLRSKGYTVGALHGDMSQNARMETLENFKNGKTGLMVATDVAARGLDIPNVGAVINYTFPLTIEDYIHRIGRTGRGGKSGKSITFFTGDAHERSLAGEFARVLREGGFDNEDLRKKFPMTIKKKEHGAYGAFYRDDIAMPKGPTKIVF